MALCSPVYFIPIWCCIPWLTMHYLHNPANHACLPGFSKDLPFYGQYGLNAGVLLLNLKAIRHSGFTQERDKILRHFYPKKALPLGDQDVLNAYAFKHPERIHVMPCIYNFRSDSACYDGFPAILHGNRNLKNNFTSTYSTLYNLFGKVNLKSEVWCWGVHGWLSQREALKSIVCLKLLVSGSALQGFKDTQAEYLAALAIWLACH